MNFLKNVLSTVVGLILFFFGLFVLVLVVGLVVSASTDNKAVVEKNSVINLDLSKVSQDYGGKVFVKDFQYSERSRDGLSDVLDAIDYAKTDKNIKGIKMMNVSSGLGISQIRELREKINEFKKTGKFVVSYADNYTQNSYYLGSVADTVYINPVGDFDFKGFSSEILYMKELQEKTGIKMEVIRHGKYKSAVEPFLEQTMSEANREQTTELLQSLWNTYAQDISKQRNISVDSLNAIANRLGARTPEMALTTKLVDKIAYLDQVDNGIKKALGVDYQKEYKEIDILDYINATYTNYRKNVSDKIAVIYAQGEIRSGEGSVNIIGEGAINRALQEARRDDNVKAVVLRVNSPGGSALTSDLILREIELTKAKKPVVVSMGDVAASGGYYIASNADRIFAEPTTITGSIGVFGMLPNFKNVADKYGVNAEQVKTHQFSNGYSVFEELDNPTREKIQEGVERVYDTFLSHVSKGRKMTKEQVDAVAQGRVWTGVKAKEIGLVDELGGLEDAIKFAAKKANVASYKTVSYPEYEIDFSELLSGYFRLQTKATQEAAIIEKIGKENYEILERVNYLKQTSSIQALMPFEIKVK